MVDQAHMKARAKPILRLHPKLVKTWPEEVASVKEETIELLNGLDQKYEEDPDELVEVLGSILDALAAAHSSCRQLAV